MRAVWALAVLLLAAIPARAEEARLSDLLLALGLLAEGPEGVVLTYAHDRRLAAIRPGEAEPVGKLKAVVDGRLELRRAPGPGGRLLTLALSEHGQPHGAFDFPAAGANPVLLFFLENVLRATTAASGGSPYYLRNRMIAALNVAVPAADEVVLTPFADDPNRARLGAFADLRLRLRFDPADPGRILGLLADIPGDPTGYSESLSLIGEAK